MTKNVKSKKLIATAGLLSAAVLCFGGAQVVKTVSNGNVGTAIVRAYATDASEEFKNAIAALETNGYVTYNVETGAVTLIAPATQPEYDGYAELFRKAFAYYGEATGKTDKEEAIYIAVYTDLSDMLTAYQYMSATLTNKLDGSPVDGTALYWSDKAEYEAYVASIEVILTVAEPDDWATNWNDYYKKTADGYVPVTDLTAPVWEADTYYYLDPSYLGDFASAYIQKTVVAYATKRTKADNRFASLALAIDDAIVAINNIVTPVTFASKASLDDATVALNAIYGVDYTTIAKSELDILGTYVTNLPVYEAALSDYNDMIEDVEKLYATLTGAESADVGKYYTYRADINAKYALYGSDAGVEYEDAVVAKLDKLYEALDGVLTAKMNVETDIAAIPAAYDYTNEYIGKVEAAEGSFANLPKDLQDAVTYTLLATEPADWADNYTAYFTFDGENYVPVTGETAPAWAADTYYSCTDDVVGKARMLAARAQIDKDAKAVTDLATATIDLVELYKYEKVEFKASVVAATNAYGDLVWPKQRADFAAKEVDPAIFDGTDLKVQDNCEDLLSYMDSKLAIINAHVAAVTDAINAIGPLELTNAGISGRIGIARTLYDALTDLEQAYVYNYYTLGLAETWLAEETAAIQAWATAVAAIDLTDGFAVSDLDAIYAVELTYAGDGTPGSGFDAATKDFIIADYDAGTDAYNYGTYLDLLTARTNLLTAIADVAADMADLATDPMTGEIDIEVICTSDATVNTFKADYEAVVAAYNFDATIKAKFFEGEAVDYADEYAVFVTAKNLYDNVIGLVCDIIALGGGDPAKVTMAEYDKIFGNEEKEIVGYVAIYEALSADNKAIVDTKGAATIPAIGGVEYTSYKDRLDKAVVNILAKKGVRDAWIVTVYDLLGDVAKDADWATVLYAVNLDDLGDVVDAYAAFTEAGDEAYLAEAYADLMTISAIATGRVETLKADITTLLAKPEITAEDIPELNRIKGVYESLDATQQALVTNYADFLVVYSTYTTSAEFDKLVDDLYANVVTKGDYTTQVPVNIAVLREIYKHLTAEAKALVKNYGKLDQIEAAYNAYNGVILDLTSVSKVVNVLINAIGDDAEGLIADIASLTLRVKALEDADLIDRIAAIEETIAVYEDDELVGGILYNLAEAQAAILTNAIAILANASDIEDILDTIAVYNEDEELVGGILYDIAQIYAAIAENAMDIATIAEQIAVYDDDDKLVGGILFEIAKAQAAIAENAGDIGDNAAAIAALQTQIAVYNEDEELVGGILFEIAKAQADIYANYIAIAANAANIGANTAAIEALQTAVTNLDNKIETVKGDLLTAISQAVNTAKNELEGKITDAKNELQTAIDNAVATLQQADTSNKAELEGKITDAKNELQTAIDNAVAALQAALDADEADIDALQEAVAQAKTAITTLEEADAVLGARIQALEEKTSGDTAALEKRVKTLEIESYILIAAVVLLAVVDVVFLILRKKA